MQRGDIYWVNLNPSLRSEIRKLRPCVIVTANAINRARRTVVVVPLSSVGVVRPPLVVALPLAGASSVAICDQIRTVDKSRLRHKEGVVADKDLAELEDCLKRVLGL